MHGGSDLLDKSDQCRLHYRTLQDGGRGALCYISYPLLVTSHLCFRIDVLARAVIPQLTDQQLLILQRRQYISLRLVQSLSNARIAASIVVEAKKQTITVNFIMKTTTPLPLHILYLAMSLAVEEGLSCHHLRPNATNTLRTIFYRAMKCTC